MNKQPSLEESLSAAVSLTGMEENLTSFYKILDSLKPYGLTYEIEASEYGLRINLDCQEYNAARARNAGRRAEWLDITYGELKRRLKEQSQESLANDLKISVKTLQRRLKAAKKYGYSDDFMM
ncbi:MAG: hypothetical protein VZQ78_08980 [Prevotella sp.]|nr:hypothetical protein [Prevotella sp.]